MSSDVECYPITLFGHITIYFPYKNPYPAQRAIMANACRAFSRQENALLESPTGTGKSLALLASALAYQKSEFEKQPLEDILNSENIEHSPSQGQVRVFYTSRTHQQLNQVVAEFKRLNYKPRMSFLASRTNLCLYEPVATSNNVDYQCRSQRNNCPYAECGKIIPEDLQSEKFDIEDLKNYCREHVRCPFMITREMAKEAQLIFCPYNYIIDHQVREQLKLDLRNSIVIFDEAHNIEDTCRETAKFTIKRSEIETIQKEMIQAINSPSEKNEWLSMIKDPLKEVLKILQMIIEWMGVKRNSRKNTETYLIEKDTFMMFNGWGLTSFAWPQISEHIKILIRPDKKTKSRLPDRLVLPLTKLYGTLVLIFQNNQDNLSDFDVVFNPGDKENNDELTFLCMNPSIVFKPIADQSHCVILSSGTMSPLQSFALELGVKFNVNLSVHHIIDKSQVAAFTISNNLDNSLKFKTSFKNMQENQTEMFKSLGFLLERFLKVIPDGCLLFVQSHNILKQLIKTWRDTKILNRLNEIKPLYYEDKSLNIKKQIEDYKNNVKSGCEGFFIGVCKGQLSEGIDFTDSQARAVFVFGIPYPSWNSPEVKLKIDYNDAHSSGYSNIQLMKGNEWYESQAKRALFQAIGRCIRHKNDYGAIILIDERYSTMISSFPKWVQESYSQAPSADSIINHLNVFYKKMRDKFPVSAGTSLNANYPLTLVCSNENCNKKAFELYKLNVKATLMIERNGFLSLIKANEPSKCVLVSEGNIKDCFAMQDEPKFFLEDENAYRLVSCNCGNVFGACVSSVCKTDSIFLNSMWLIPSSLIVQQGPNQLPLMKVMKLDDENNNDNKESNNSTSSSQQQTTQNNNT